MIKHIKYITNLDSGKYAQHPITKIIMGDKNEREADKEEVFYILKRIESLTDTIHIMGGEPCLRPDIKEIINICNSLFKRVELYTYITDPRRWGNAKIINLQLDYDNIMDVNKIQNKTIYGHSIFIPDLGYDIIKKLYKKGYDGLTLHLDYKTKEQIELKKLEIPSDFSLIVRKWDYIEESMKNILVLTPNLYLYGNIDEIFL